VIGLGHKEKIIRVSIPIHSFISYIIFHFFFHEKAYAFILEGYWNKFFLVDPGDVRQLQVASHSFYLAFIHSFIANLFIYSNYFS